MKLFLQSEYLIDRIQSSEIIHNRLSDPINLCYLEFLECVLPYVVDVNLEFQSEKPKVYLLHLRMSTLFKTIAEFYLKPEYLNKTAIENVDYKNPRNFLNLENMYFGPKLASKLAGGDFPENIKKELMKRCLDFYIELLNQICKRFPFKSEFVKGLKLLDFIVPSNLKKIQSLGPLSNYFKKLTNEVDINELDCEWR